MQFNLVNDQEQVAQFVRRGMAWRSVALRDVALGFIVGLLFGVVAFVCFLVFPLPFLPIRGSRGFSSIVSPLNSLFSVTGA